MLNRLVSLFNTILRSFFMLLFLTTIPARGEAAVVRAILFYSPSCGHCHYVITELLIPMVEEYGDQLQIIGIDISEPDGSAIFSATLETFDIPMELAGVPFLVIGDQVLIGSQDIPDRFPGLVEIHLAQGGVDWPLIPGLAEALTEGETADSGTAEPEATTAVTATPDVVLPVTINEEIQAESSLIVQSQSLEETPTTSGSAELISSESPGPRSLSVAKKVALDPVGNSLSILILIVMVVVVIYQIIYFQRPTRGTLPDWHDWAIPIICLVGLVVAGYLAYVETADVTAVCGPVGDCNTVQQSVYARLFGILPVGILGLIGYLAILFVWLISRFVSRDMKAKASLVIFGMALCGTIFSIYLTFLEPFVIGATCAWCLSSAVLITLLYWLSSGKAKRAVGILAKPSKKYKHSRLTQRS